jgi:2',3'-cyclic-nucleotide 2'-phosphodiesterase (5'-nucleotidase family)
VQRLLTLIFGYHFILAACFSQILILESSDHHSDYGRMGNWIKTISKVSREFKTRHPDGTVILVVNGDFVGARGTWTRLPQKPGLENDHGRLGYEVLSLLAQDAEIILTPGNHEEFDWAIRGGSYSIGHELFLRHHRDFAAAMENLKERPFRMTAANVVPGADGKELFEPFTDVPLRSGGSVRFVGLLLENFFIKSNYYRVAAGSTPPEGYLDLISDVRPMWPSLHEALVQAQKDRQEFVVVAAHDWVGNLLNLSHTVSSHSGDFGIAGVRTPLWLGGHEHERVVNFVDGRHFAQCGSNCDLIQVEMDADGKVSKVLGISNKQQVANAEYDGLSSNEALALELVEKRVSAIRAANPDAHRVLANLHYGAPPKSRFKQGRQDAGTVLSEMLRKWGANIPVRMDYPIPITADIAFYNSSSYRIDDQLEPGATISVKDVEDIHPFEHPVGVFIVSGAEASFLFNSLRKNRLEEGVYSPQLSVNLREVGAASDKPGQLVIWTGSEWEALNPNAHYRLTMDPWLSSNGYGIHGWETILGGDHAQTHWSSDPRTTNVENVLKSYVKLFECPDLLLAVPSSTLSVSGSSVD